MVQVICSLCNTEQDVSLLAENSDDCIINYKLKDEVNDFSSSDILSGSTALYPMRRLHGELFLLQMQVL